MSAISTYELMLFPGGPLPSEIFSDEPGGVETIPTRVDYRDGFDVPETYRQDLDDRGRLLRVTLGSAASVYMTREWTGDNTYIDRMAEGWQRRVDDGPDGEMRITRPDGGLVELWEYPAENPGDYAYRHAREISIPGAFPETHVAELDPGGRVILEQRWNTAAYDEDMPPNRYRHWTYSDSGRLVMVADYHARPERQRPPYYVEEHRWVGDKTLRIIGSYPDRQPELIGRQQIREYDANGRVERITGQISIPTSAMSNFEMQLSYD